jgi:exopolyphosphatase/guanosine-5'-triphosphate,3'-diphosphate pyrophosphatase
VATSAVREAANRSEFVARLEAEAGEPVEVVSGEDEARLTLRGVASELPGLGDAFVLFDIGGGSTEFVRARGGRAAAAVSLRLGVVPLVEEWGEPGPVRWDRFARMRAGIERQLAGEVPEAIRGRGGQLVGTAGRHDAGRARPQAARLRRGPRPRPPARAGVGGARAGPPGLLSVADRGRLPCLSRGAPT